MVSTPARRSLLLAGLALVAALPVARAEDKLPVVATFSILGDMARTIGGARVAVVDLVGPDQDAHVYQPSPGDARRLREAKVILANGLGFDAFLDRLVSASGTTARPVIASRDVTPLKAAGRHGHGAHDPHAWLDVANARLYARTLASALAAADPAGAPAYADGLAGYLAMLDGLDADIRAAVAAIAPERRRVVTTHDSFSYFARAYGIEFLALQGVSTEAEPSAADLARIIRQTRAAKAPAVFLENIVDPRKAQRIAQETGAKIGGTLFSDALSAAGGPAPSYIAMMRHNIRQLKDALAP